MEKVIDSNYLNHPDLEHFLANPKNIVVVPDFVQLEAIKSNDLTLIRQRISTLEKHPKQVKILKSTREICGLNGRTKGLKRRLICRSQTQGFKSFCTNLFDRSDSNKSNLNAFIVTTRDAKVFFESNTSSVNEFIEIYEDFRTQFSEQEIKLIRQGKVPNEEVFKKLFSLVALLAGSLFEKLPNCSRWPKTKEWPNLYIHRNSLFNCLYFLEWIKKGSPMKLNADKLHNDIIDLHICTYATYFDGLLTKDENCKRRFLQGNDLLKNAIIPFIDCEHE